MVQLALTLLPLPAMSPRRRSHHFQHLLWNARLQPHPTLLRFRNGKLGRGGKQLHAFAQHG
jgi:hypothetical protein